MSKTSLRIFSPQLGMSPQSALGGEVYDREVLKRLANKGNKIHILLPKNKPYDHSIKKYQLSFAPLSHIAPPHLYNLFIIPRAAYLITKKQINLIRIHVPEFFGPSVWILKKLFPRVPVIGHYHLDEPGFLFNLINRLFLNSCDLIIADSQYLAKKVHQKFSISKSKIKVIYCGTDIKIIKPGKKDPKLVAKYHLQNNLCLLYLGLFIKRKNPQFLIRLLARLKQQYPHVKLIMIGKGPEEKNLKQMAKKLHVNRNVIFPGPQYGKSKLRFYQTADIFTFPSSNEGFVLSVLEAMAAGLPLIVPNTVSFPEAVSNGINGYLCKPNDVNSWLKVIHQLLQKYQLRHRLSSQARKVASDKFSWQSCVSQLENAYIQAVNKCETQYQ